MSNENKDPKSKKGSDQIGMWLVIGAGLGIAFGSLYHNITVGITFGAALGLIFGAALSQTNKK